MAETRSSVSETSRLLIHLFNMKLVNLSNTRLHCSFLRLWRLREHVGGGGVGSAGICVISTETSAVFRWLRRRKINTAGRLSDEKGRNLLFLVKVTIFSTRPTLENICKTTKNKRRSLDWNASRCRRINNIPPQLAHWRVRVQRDKKQFATNTSPPP